MPRHAVVCDGRNNPTSLRMAFEAEHFDVETLLDPLEALPLLIPSSRSLDS
jgi:hypothetical protein